MRTTVGSVVLNVSGRIEFSKTQPENQVGKSSNVDCMTSFDFGYSESPHEKLRRLVHFRFDPDDPAHVPGTDCSRWRGQLVADPVPEGSGGERLMLTLYGVTLGDVQSALVGWQSWAAETPHVLGSTLSLDLITDRLQAAALI